MEQKFCTHCGASLIQITRFCPHCGSPLQAAQTSDEQHAQPQYNPNQYSQYGYPYQQAQYIPHPIYYKPKVPGRGFSISSMVLGIIAMVISFSLFASTVEAINELKNLDRVGTIISEEISQAMMSFVIVSSIYSILSILAISFAIGAFAKKNRCGKSISGLVLGIVSLLLFVGSIVLSVPYI